MTTLNLASVTETLKRDLYTAVVSDTLDQLGYRDQVMNANINPVTEHVVLVGRARTLLAVDYYEPLSDPYGVELKFIDTLVTGDVVVAGTNMSVRNGLWGELLSTASKYRGACGAIIDGYVRDVRKIRQLGFPTWATGTKPVDSAGRGLTIAYDIPVRCGDVIVKTGDIIFADEDGIVAIPQAIFSDVIERALEKVHAEDSSRKDLLMGTSLSEVYRQRGVL
jgi:regulator of RNase E activity RraA